MNNKLNSGALTGRFSTKTSFIQLLSANRGESERGRAEWNLKTSCVITIVSVGPVLRLIIYMTGHGKRAAAWGHTRQNTVITQLTQLTLQQSQRYSDIFSTRVVTSLSGLVVVYVVTLHYPG